MPSHGVARFGEVLSSSEFALEQYQENPEEYVEGFNLDEEEREILARGDPSEMRDLLRESFDGGHGPAAGVWTVVIVL